MKTIKAARLPLVVLAAILSPSLVTAATYSITDLGVDGRTAAGVAIDDFGNRVIGVEADYLGEQRPLLFHNGMQTVDVRPFFPNGAMLKEGGQLLGAVPVEGNSSSLKLYADGNLSEVGAIPHPDARVFGVNEHFDYIAVVGPASAPFSVVGAIGASTVVEIGSLGGGTTIALGINNAGQVVGVSSTGLDAGSGEVFEEAFLYDRGVMRGLGTLGGISSVARAINNLGTAVGESQVTVNGPVHAFVYDPAAGMRGIGMPGLNGIAVDVNESGVIVGSAERLPNVWRAAIFDEANGVQFLEDLIPKNSNWEYLFCATDINNLGQIAGLGLIGGELHGFLLTPTPEPASAVLLLLAGAALLMSPRARRENGDSVHRPRWPFG